MNLVKTGYFNKLEIVRKTDFGYYLNSGTGKSSDDILLPNRSALNQKLDIGDKVEVFIYRDSSDRLIATLKKPIAKVGEIAYLKVVSNTQIGSFIDFGLEKDILVPFREKTYPLEEGRYYLFYIYLDKTGRIAATTNIERYLDPATQYKVGDTVSGTVCAIKPNRNLLIAVDNIYRGVILANQYFTNIRAGEILELRINKIFEDGTLGLTPRNSAKVEVAELQQIILDYLKKHNGFMIFNDKSSPEDLYNEFHVSKKHFKEALGGLMKKNLITQNEDGTRLI